MDIIFAFFVGVMCFLHVFSLLVNQSVKIGEKFIDFRNMGDWYLLSVLTFFILGCIGFYFALRSTKNIKKYPEYLVCLKCKATWWFGHLRDKSKCNFCGGEVMDANKYGDYIRKLEFLEKKEKGPKRRSVRNKRKKDKGNVDD
ncbi:hypothetical protein [Campylobacter concisus]|uniref:hypothetical protein n=1 Tax=Campylobacter concisus TaxID=199 RepID=UPI000CD83FF9|nr:hypothetical protein [Campylobacter concisus]